ncbi:MAG: heat-inducible transcriptional repressor HrcA [Thiotrichaceae bacterium]|nr:heat-inducible transcriptional repressor HrcA [Thiotrichaceae bacterium]
MAKIKDKIDERAQYLLRLLVNKYIKEGRPVGSRTLAKELDVDLSSATIRNIMADLEDMGLVRSPHTSAGRIPTVLGYRLFVDSLLQVKPLESSEIQIISRQLAQAQQNEQELLTQTSSLLSEITHLASVVMLPRRLCNTLRHVEFLALSDKRVLVILVVNDHEVQNKIIQTSRQYSSVELERTSNYLNNAFIGKDLNAVRSQIMNEMQETRESMDKLMQAVIEMTTQVFPDKASSKGDYVMSGQTNLMDIVDLSDIEKLRHLFSAFNQKHDILQLFDQVIDSQGMQVFIGDESGYEVLGDCSIVTSPYVVNGEIIGVLGIIGPTRMAYERIIPVVNLTAKLLGSALNH